MKLSRPNLGKRRKISIEGERYYLLVTQGGDGWTVEISAAHDVPPHSKTRRIVETLVEAVNGLVREARDASA